MSNVRLRFVLLSLPAKAPTSILDVYLSLFSRTISRFAEARPLHDLPSPSDCRLRLMYEDARVSVFQAKVLLSMNLPDKVKDGRIFPRSLFLQLMDPSRLTSFFREPVCEFCVMCFSGRVTSDVKCLWSLSLTICPPIETPMLFNGVSLKSPLTRKSWRVRVFMIAVLSMDLRPEDTSVG